MSAEGAHPLAWPRNWPRTPYRRFGPFKCTFNVAREHLSDELERLGARLPVLSTNLPLRLDGFPYANAGNPADPGVATYFTLKNKRLVLACDRWSRIEHNMRAIAKHIESIRGQERWGVGSVEQAFTGYAALPEKTEGETWWEVFGFQGPNVSMTDVEFAFRALVKVDHPDIAGGSSDRFKRLTRARDEAYVALKK